MTKNIFLYLVTLLFVTGVIFSCKHHPDFLDIPLNPGGGNNPPDTVVITNPNPCDPNVVYFQTTILPLLTSKCAQPDCHDQATQEDGVGLFDYNNVMEQVDPGDLNGSDLWEMITETDPDDRMPPPPNAPLTQQERDLIRNWILQGAQNNTCTPDCNPDEFSFSVNLFPIVQLHCQGCHSGSQPDGGISLTNYTQVKAVADNGLLMSALNGTNGSPLMPYNTLGLPDCYKSQFQTWVDAGAPNN